jgi:hypothetical protein
MEHSGVDIAHTSGLMDPKRRDASAARSQQSGLPKPSMRAPSPGARSMPETKSRGITASRFGFGRPSAKNPNTSSGITPELKGKHSRNVLRRKPSSIAQHTVASRPGPARSESSSPTKWSQTSSENYANIEASLKSAGVYNEVFTRTNIPSVKSSPSVIPELDRYRTRPEQAEVSNHRFVPQIPHKLATQDLPPPTPQYSGTPMYSGLSGHNRYSGYSGSGYSASPSTRFSESPGPGAFSRDTTPTSM